MGHFPDSKGARLAVFLSAVFIPGSGFVWLGKPARGLLYLAWIVFFGYLTYHLTTARISPVGRYSGGLAIWALSLVEMYRLLKIKRQ